MTYINYNDLADIPLIDAQNIVNSSWVPWISTEKVDAKYWLFNTPNAITNPMDIVWRNTSIVWTATDYRTVTWTGWQINLPDWTVYNISSWNTGNLSWITYIYLDINTSTTVLQKTTTASTAVWAGKLMVCVADKNGDTTKKATFQAFWTKGAGVFITADNIAVNSITANEIQTNTITALNLTSWTITGLTITWWLFRTAITGKRIEIESQPDNVIDFYNNSWYAGSIEADDTERSIKITWYYWFIVSVPNTVSITGTDVNIKAVRWDITLDWYVKITSNHLNFTWSWGIYADWWLTIGADYWVTISTTTTAGGDINPWSSIAYNLWNSSYKRAWVYTSVLYTSAIQTGWSVQTATTTSNRYVAMNINWTNYKLLLAT